MREPQNAIATQWLSREMRNRVRCHVDDRVLSQQWPRDPDGLNRFGGLYSCAIAAQLFTAYLLTYKGGVSKLCESYIFNVIPSTFLLSLNIHQHITNFLIKDHKSRPRHLSHLTQAECQAHMIKVVTVATRVIINTVRASSSRATINMDSSKAATDKLRTASSKVTALRQLRAMDKAIKGSNSRVVMEGLPSKAVISMDRANMVNLSSMVRISTGNSNNMVNSSTVSRDSSSLTVVHGVKVSSPSSTRIITSTKRLTDPTQARHHPAMPPIHTATIASLRIQTIRKKASAASWAP